ncbi:MAG: polymer-forming cytoskeletal protein [Myxococcota bacterium]
MVRRTLPALATAGALMFAVGAYAQSDEPTEPIVPDVPEIVEAEVPAERFPDGFGADDNVRFDQPHDDIFGMGEAVEVKARVADNAFVMGREVTIDAPIGGDVFAMGETVTINQVVDGDVYAMGAEVSIGPDGSVDGDIYGLAGEILVEGPVAGTLNGATGQLTLASVVSGDVNVDVGELIARDGARILGDLDYRAPDPTDGIDGVVDGEVTFTVDTDEDFASFEVEEPTAFEAAMGWTGWRLWDYLSKLLVGIVFIAIGGAAASRVSQTLQDKPAESLGIGFLTLIALPAASVLCIATVIPMSLGFLGLITWGVLMFLGQIVVGRWLGDLILGAVRPDRESTPYAALAVGLIPVSLAFGLPWVAFLAVLTASLLGMGAIVKSIVRPVVA